MCCMLRTVCLSHLLSRKWSQANRRAFCSSLCSPTQSTKWPSLPSTLTDRAPSWLAWAAHVSLHPFLLWLLWSECPNSSLVVSGNPTPLLSAQQIILVRSILIMKSRVSELRSPWQPWGEWCWYPGYWNQRSIIRIIPQHLLHQLF